MTIAIFLLIISLFIYLNIRQTKKQQRQLFDIKSNPIEEIRNVCLTKTRISIGIKKEHYCYYDFTLTDDFIIAERKPNLIIFEQAILIKRKNQLTNHNGLGNILNPLKAVR